MKIREVVKHVLRWTDTGCYVITKLSFCI